MKPALVDVSVLILFFNRPKLLAQVFEQVKKARPARLFLYQDGPRGERDMPGIEACRKVVADIDWECEVHHNYQEKNYGCDPSEYMAQKWAFSLSDKCIVLEDDDVPAVSFFGFCKELLDKYEHDTRISMIAGFNNEEITPDITSDYFFATTFSIWGWASWRRVTDQWDEFYTFLDDKENMRQLKNLIHTRRYRNYDDVQRMRVIMSILGFAILFIAALNYVLISISSLSYRAKSVGVHKCSGASGGTVFSMFLLETGIIIVAALLLMALIMLNFRDFVEDTVVVKLSTLLAPERIWVPLSVVLLLFIVGGVLPGRLFARIPVSQVFRRYTEGKKGWKRPLLFVQFAGVAFISGLMCVVMSQYQYVLKKDMGYNPKQIAIGNAYWDNEATRDAAYQFFKGLPYVEAVSSANSTPISGYSGSMIHSESGQALFSCRSSYFMREDFPALMGMTMKTGRMARDKEEVVVNETFAEMMRWGDDVVGRTVYTEGNTFKVVGQLKDFQIESFRTEKMPFIARGNKNFYGTVHVRLKEPFTENLQKLNHDVAEAFHDQTIDFTGYEKRIENSYNSVRVFRNATLMAAVTMFFIMLMGLIGYTTDEVRRRSKEIAIRKVNGAEASGILEMLSRDILVVAAPAVVIGTVLAWYVNGMWMEQFAERIHISWAVYVLVVMANLVIIVACVLWKSWRIANENPVNSIKSE